MKKTRGKIFNTRIDKLLDLISEAGMLKQVRRSGWSVLGIKDAESVADHSFRCAVIGYILARIEGACAYKVLLMTLFNDIHEARIFDLHKMAQRYIDGRKAEKDAFKEQISSLPLEFKKELTAMRKEYMSQKTKESIVARDADVLECLIQAREYQTHGHLEAGKFMKKAPRVLKTASARKLWRLALKKDINNWWVRLSAFSRL